MDHHRHSIRLPGFDYRSVGAYFVTICAFQREHLFGKIENEEMKLTDAGKIIQTFWEEIPIRFKNVKLDEVIIMPNHVHGIIWITDFVGAGSPRPGSLGPRSTVPAGRGGVTPPLQRGSLGQIIAYWKYNSAKRIHIENPLFGSVWQRNYYEHIIRDERSLFAIRQYIRDNPRNWERDPERYPLGKV